MTEQQDLVDRLTESRRSLLKKGAATAGAVALGASGTVAAQEDDDENGDDDGVVNGDESWEALIFVSQFNPQGRFAVVSDVVEWVPNYGDVTDSWFADYNTYQIRWHNTDNVVPLFVAEDAPIGEYDSDLGFVPDADDDQDQPQLYEMNRDWAPFGDNERLVNVNVSPVDEETEDQVLDADDWWLDDDDDEATPNGTETPAGNGNETNAGN